MQGLSCVVTTAHWGLGEDSLLLAKKSKQNISTSKLSFLCAFQQTVKGSRRAYGWLRGDLPLIILSGKALILESILKFQAAWYILEVVRIPCKPCGHAVLGTEFRLKDTELWMGCTLSWDQSPRALNPAPIKAACTFSRLSSPVSSSLNTWQGWIVARIHVQSKVYTVLGLNECN